MLVGTASKQLIIQGKSYYMGYRNRELGTKVHKMALDKVMHGSVNKYYDVTPIGRVIQKFNNEIHVFKGGLLRQVQETFNSLSKVIFQFGFLCTVSNWTFAVLALALIYILRIYFFWSPSLKKLR